MPEQNPLVPVGLGILLILFGAVNCRNPVWVHKAGYKWVAFVASELMRPSQRRDMEQLFRNPTEWTERHRFAVTWTRATLGYGPLVMGFLAIGLGVLYWILS